MSNPLDDMYREVILDHYRAPRGKKKIDNANITSEGQNPSCGDEIDVQLRTRDGKVEDVHVSCQGCAISVASGSMLAELIKGKTLAEVTRIAELVRKMLKGELDELPDELKDLGDIDALQGVKQFPVRIKCALLSWITLIEGVKNFESGNSDKTAFASTEDD